MCIMGSIIHHNQVMKMTVREEKTNNIQITSMMLHVFRSNVIRLNVQKLAVL